MQIASTIFQMGYVPVMTIGNKLIKGHFFALQIFVPNAPKNFEIILFKYFIVL